MFWCVHGVYDGSLSTSEFDVNCMSQGRSEVDRTDVTSFKRSSTNSRISSSVGSAVSQLVHRPPVHSVQRPTGPATGSQVVPSRLAGGGSWALTGGIEDSESFSGFNALPSDVSRAHLKGAVQRRHET